MLILPAIDLLGGCCVRLVKGEYGSASRVAADPLKTAEAFAAAGARMIHTVDLDGARGDESGNFSAISSIVSGAGIPVETGGGIRDMKTAEKYIGCGVRRIILGTAALRSPDFVRECVKEYGDRVAVGIDAKNGIVCADGWTTSSGVGYTDFAKKMESIGVTNIIFTDIDRDGTLTEPNFLQLAALGEAVPAKITASGGIRDISHIKKLASMGIYAAICGKSIYSGTLCLSDAIKAAGEQII